MVQINGPAISVWISWIVIILTSQDTWSHVSLSTVEIWYILEGCTKWSPGRQVMYSNRLCRPTPGCRYSWFIFEGSRTFKWDIKWPRRLKHCWFCGVKWDIHCPGCASFYFSAKYIRVKFKLFSHSIEGNNCYCESIQQPSCHVTSDLFLKGTTV